MDGKKKLFRKRFIDALMQEKKAKSTIEHYIKNLGLSYNDAILRFADEHSIIPEYYYTGDAISA